MIRFLNLLCVGSLGLLLAGVIVGCGAPQGTGTTPPVDTPSTSGSAQDAISKALAELSEADRAAALKQKVCPVTGVALGKMGTPPKVTVEGREVFLCCDGCKETLRGDPKKYLAKLDAKQP